MTLVLAALVALVAATPAWAAVSDASDSYKVASVEVTGIEDGNTLTLYKIVQFNLDAATNEFTYTLADGLPAAYDTIDELGAITDDGYVFTEGSAAKACADTLANAIAEGTVTPIATVNATAASEKATIADLPAGWYVAVVTGTADTGIIYQNMIINAMPVVDEANNTYKSADNVSFEVKHSDEIITKTVADAESTDAYSVGDSVPFKIETTIPNYPNPSKVATFKITDTPSDLTDDITAANGFTVTVNGTEVERVDSLQATGATYTVTPSGDGFVIEFAKSFLHPRPPRPVRGRRIQRDHQGQRRDSR